MRLFALTLAVLASLCFVKGADPRCDRGIASASKAVCCPDYCSSCGARDCAKKRGGYFECCVDGVKKKNRNCNVSEAPCTMSSGGGTSYNGNGDPRCGSGRLHADGKTCCNKSCGNECGGNNCSWKKGGPYNCCASAITKSGRSCDNNKPPCIIRSGNIGKVVAPRGNSGSVRRNTVIAVLPGPRMSMQQREKRYGIKFDAILLYQKTPNLNWSWVKNHLDAGRKVELCIEFMERYPNLNNIAGGQYDGVLKRFASEAARDGRRISVRFMHEFNGDWYAWGVFRAGNSVNSFKNAFRHVSRLFRNSGANFNIQLAYNSANARDIGTPLREFYPGDEFLDEVCISAYNFAGTSRYHKAYESLSTVLTPAYNEITSFTNKPLCLGEFGTTSYGGDKTKWIMDAWVALAYQFPRIRTMTWFFSDELDKRPVFNWDLHTSSQEWAFSDGFRKFEAATRVGAGDESSEALDALPTFSQDEIQSLEDAILADKLAQEALNAEIAAQAALDAIIDEASDHGTVPGDRFEDAPAAGADRSDGSFDEEGSEEYVDDTPDYSTELEEDYYETDAAAYDDSAESEPQDDEHFLFDLAAAEERNNVISAEELEWRNQQTSGANDEETLFDLAAVEEAEMTVSAEEQQWLDSQQEQQQSYTMEGEEGSEIVMQNSPAADSSPELELHNLN